MKLTGVEQLDLRNELYQAIAPHFEKARVLPEHMKMSASDAARDAMIAAENFFTKRVEKETKPK